MSVKFIESPFSYVLHSMYIDLELCITFFAVIRCNNFIIIFESYVQMFLLHYLQFALNCCIYDWVSITSANTFNWKIMIFFSLFYEFQTNITSSLLSGIREEKSMTSSPLSKEPVSWNEKHDPKVRKIRWWIIEMWIRKVQTIHNSWKQYFPHAFIPSEFWCRLVFFYRKSWKLLKTLKYRISEWAVCQVWKFLHPQGWKILKN